MSRIAPKKNLDGVLRVLKRCDIPIDLNIYGLIEDPAYWTSCQRLLEALPPNINARYCGVARDAEVARALAHHDLLFLPTRNENFGHIIFEALSCGCPVLISDQTAFRDLAKAGCGWDFPVDAEDDFRACLYRVARMDVREHARLVACARAYADEVTSASDAISRHRQMFRDAVVAG